MPPPRTAFFGFFFTNEQKFAIGNEGIQIPLVERAKQNQSNKLGSTYTMRKINTLKIASIAALLLAGFMGCIASDQTQGDVPVTGQGSSPYVGTYYAYAKMTNGSGLFWITP